MRTTVNLLSVLTRGAAPILAAAIFLWTVSSAAQPVSFDVSEGRLEITVEKERIATYVWDDPVIQRPYFCNVVAPNGYQVTRTYPIDPEADAGNEDHSTFHPGIWLAFGDLDGADFWRLHATVRHVGFRLEPQGGQAVGRFEVHNIYETHDDPPRIIAEEFSTYCVRVTDNGYLIESESRFTPKTDDVVFGDQEEMGLGLRLATPLTVKHGSGVLLNSEGGHNEEGTWGKQARWCAGLAEVDEVHIGAVVMTCPDNFRESWFHSRDYGLIVANPFGRKAMTAPRDADVSDDSTPVNDMRLRFAIGLFSTVGDPVTAIEALYEAYTNGE